MKLAGLLPQRATFLTMVSEWIPETSKHLDPLAICRMSHLCRLSESVTITTQPVSTFKVSLDDRTLGTKY